MLGYVPGGWDDDTFDNNIGAMSNQRNLEWSAFAFEDTESKREDNCYVVQERTTGEVNEERLLLALGSGSAIPLGVVALSDDIISQDLRNLVNQGLFGSWDSYARSGNRSCGWKAGADGNTTYYMSRWRAVAEDETGKALRLMVKGDVGFGTNNVTGTDRTYCGLMISYYEGDDVIVDETNPDEIETFELCKQLPDSGDAPTPRAKCNTCYTDNNGIWTALGCLPKDRNPLIRSLVQVGLSIAGGIALLSILVASFMFSTSRGDAKRVTDARELLQSAIIGLLFIIFSVTILQFIGVTLFRIPGFGG